MTGSATGVSSPRPPVVAASETALALHRRINRTTRPYPQAGVPELFHAVARRYPDRPAVVHDGGTLTYRRLAGLGDALAARLAADGVRPGDVVAVHVPRSPERLVALLAVLTCGAAYLPVDADWPDARLRELLALSDCRRLLSNAGGPLRQRLPECPHTAVTDSAPPELLPRNEIDPDAIAYINFTSGSTGRPKGVPVRHRSVVRLVSDASYTSLDTHSRVLHMASPAFDAATFEIWAPLLHGGACVLYPPGLPRLSRLRRTLREHRVGTVFLTTALFNTIVDEAPDTLDTVSAVLTGGEAHSLPHIRRALERYGPDRLTSVYGPTETTTFATYHPITGMPPPRTALPIGRPIQNTGLFLLREGRLCGPGEVGEIWLSGPGLSPGYLGDLAETRARFVEHEVDGVVRRLYRTGDRGYFLDNGDVVFHGRVDRQVKVRGHRIELEEVTQHVNQHPGVRRSYVTVADTAGGDRELVAFVVAADGTTAQDLRRHLAARLPAYMVPARVFLCAALPLSPQGKVDRAVLLATCSTSTAERTPHGDPQQASPAVPRTARGAGPRTHRGRTAGLHPHRR